MASVASCVIFPSFTRFILQGGCTAVGVNCVCVCVCVCVYVCVCVCVCVCVFWHLAHGMLQVGGCKFPQVNSANNCQITGSIAKCH